MRLSRWLGRRGTRTVPVGILILALFAAVNASAVTNEALPEEEIPPLRPPRPEIPATFWELHGGEVIAGSAALVLLLAGGVWWWRRPRPRAVVPPEVRARQELAPLRTQPETGEVLSRISQIVRHYVTAAFNLGEGELTTTDLSQAMAVRKETIGPQLAGSISGFLRACDERKFAPPAQRPPMGAADRAEKLVESLEARRAELRAAEQAAQPQETGRS